jgi:cytochrome c peroxidase
MGLQKGVYRTPDALLYALALYINSLQGPPNPSPFDDEARHGQEIFMKTAGCAQCHTPPFYSNNKLTLAQGFTPSQAELKNYDIMNLSIGTDPGLALKTRKGTGFYRVPSLKMLWTNDVFLHDGSVSSLEEMFNPNRAAKGHPFGLNLNADDRRALVKFLKTL